MHKLWFCTVGERQVWSETKKKNFFFFLKLNTEVLKLNVELHWQFRDIHHVLCGFLKRQQKNSFDCSSHEIGLLVRVILSLYKVLAHTLLQTFMGPQRQLRHWEGCSLKMGFCMWMRHPIKSNLKASECSSVDFRITVTSPHGPDKLGLCQVEPFKYNEDYYDAGTITVGTILVLWHYNC